MYDEIDADEVDLGYDDLSWIGDDPDEYWKVEIEVTTECNACYGTGIDRNVDADCLVCYGEGQL